MHVTDFDEHGLLPSDKTLKQAWADLHPYTLSL